jgi:hypothetical protein
MIQPATLAERKATGRQNNHLLYQCHLVGIDADVDVEKWTMTYSY